MRRTIKSYNVFILTNHYMCTINIINKHIRTQGFNVVHPNLGYIHNGWLLLLFIHSLHYNGWALLSYNNIY